MRKRVRWGLAVALGFAVASLGSSCSMLEGKYKMEIVPDGTIIPELRQLHLIVSRDEFVSEILGDSSDLEKLLDGEKLRRYERYASFEPTEAGEWTLVPNSSRSRNDKIEFEVDEHAIEIIIPESVFKDSATTMFAVVVLADYADGLQSVDILHADLVAAKKQQLRISSADLTLTIK